MLQYINADNICSSDVAAVFTTRNGGVSGAAAGQEHFSSLNLQLSAGGDDDANIVENYRIITSSLGFRAEDVVSLDQKHTDRIIAVDGPISEEADALVTNKKGLLLSVRTADCVPILLYDRVNSAVAAIHSGWRGSYKQIGIKTVNRMTELFGTAPSDIQAAIGPAIGVCCYEVDTDFHERFINEHGKRVEVFFRCEPTGKTYCNLSAMNKAFLMEAGIPEMNIDVSQLCTMCNPKLFYSHRRSGFKRGSMAAFIGMYI